MEGPSAALFQGHRGDGAEHPASPSLAALLEPRVAQPWSGVTPHRCCPWDDPRGCSVLPAGMGLPPRLSRAVPCQAVPAPHRARDAGGNRLRAGKEVEAERISVLVHTASLCPTGGLLLPKPPSCPSRGCSAIPAGFQSSRHRMDARVTLTGLCAGTRWDWRAPGVQAGLAQQSPRAQSVLASPSLEPPAPFSSPGQGWAISATVGLGVGTGGPGVTELRGRDSWGQRSEGQAPGQDRSRPTVTPHTHPALSPSAGGEVKPKPQKGQNPHKVQGMVQPHCSCPPAGPDGAVILQ